MLKTLSFAFDTATFAGLAALLAPNTALALLQFARWQVVPLLPQALLIAGTLALIGGLGALALRPQDEHGMAATA